MCSEARKCIACNGKRIRVSIVEAKQARVVPPETLLRCQGCGLRWVEAPIGQSKQADYDEDYFSGFQDLDACAGGFDELADHLKKRLKEMTERNGKPGKMLEVGCSVGLFLAEAEKLGWKTQGVDVSEWAAKIAKERFNINVKVGNLTELDLPQDEFDIAHLNHTFEHVPNPLETLRVLYGILRPGGRLYIEVPNEFEAFYDKIRGGLLSRYDLPQLSNHHLYFYNVTSLKLLLKSVGFEITKIETPRRNKQLDSRFPCGSWIKRFLYNLEEKRCWGPNIIMIAQRPH